MFNIGKKDEHGRQRRIEHRGRHLRASRTGGVALRAQTKAAGVNLTANTSQGVRLSTAVGPGTQVALQNGRFVLRGRYGAGPLRFNLSRSGLSLSAKNRLGAFNLTNPNQSSAKIGGVQLRGQKAASLQAVYLVITTAFQLIRFAIGAAVLLGQLLWWVVRVLGAVLVALPGWVRDAARGLRNARIRRRIQREGGLLSDLPDDEEGLKTALALVYEGWGRGRAAGVLAEGQGLGEAAQSVATGRDAAFNGLPADERTMEATTAHIAEGLRRRLSPEALPEVILAMDDRALEAGPRTRRQARMLEVIADFAGLRLTAGEAEESAPEAEEPEDRAQPEPATSVPEPDTPDINTADAETLATLPGIGESRARDIIAHRPFSDLDGLQSISGIGPATVARLREAGVRCL